MIPFTYARAGELGLHTVPGRSPRVRVVPYNPTNSLIISGPRTSVEELINIIEPATRD